MIGGANSFFGITPGGFGAVGARVNFIVAFAVDKVTKEPPEHIHSMVEAARIRGGAKTVGGAHRRQARPELNRQTRRSRAGARIGALPAMLAGPFVLWRDRRSRSCE